MPNFFYFAWANLNVKTVQNVKKKCHKCKTVKNVNHDKNKKEIGRNTKIDNQICKKKSSNGDISIKIYTLKM